MAKVAKNCRKLFEQVALMTDPGFPAEHIVLDEQDLFVPPSADIPNVIRALFANRPGLIELLEHQAHWATQYRKILRLAFGRVGVKQQWWPYLLCTTNEDLHRVEMIRDIKCNSCIWTGSGLYARRDDLFLGSPIKENAWRRALELPVAACPQCGCELSMKVLLALPRV